MAPFLDVAAVSMTSNQRRLRKVVAGAVDGVLDAPRCHGGGADEFDQFGRVLAHSMQQSHGNAREGVSGSGAARDGGGWEGKIRVFFSCCGGAGHDAIKDPSRSAGRGRPNLGQETRKAG